MHARYSANAENPFSPDPMKDASKIHSKKVAIKPGRYAAQNNSLHCRGRKTQTLH